MNSPIKKADYLFLDCEWADIFASELVSIAIVSIDGLRYFYGEVDVLPEDPTPWVREVVYPLLERGDCAMSIELMSARLRRFLDGFDAPLVCHDCSFDRSLCEHLLADTGLEGEAECPAQVRWLLMGDVQPALRTWWKEHPENGALRHNALVDARALRSAFLSLWGI